MPYNRRKYTTTAASKKAIAIANITIQTISGNAAGIANANIIQNGDSGILIDSPASPTITNNTIQAYFSAVMTDPEDWIEKLNFTGNNVTDGPPEITIVTVTPLP